MARLICSIKTSSSRALKSTSNFVHSECYYKFSVVDLINKIIIIIMTDSAWRFGTWELTKSRLIPLALKHFYFLIALHYVNKFCKSNQWFEELQNSNVVYHHQSIAYQKAPFTVLFQSSLFTINNADGTVTLEEPLDYETEKFYQLEIMAKVRKLAEEKDTLLIIIWN